jgi:hypothetical protein
MLSLPRSKVECEMCEICEMCERMRVRECVRKCERMWEGIENV